MSGDVVSLATDMTLNTPTKIVIYAIEQYH